MKKSINVCFLTLFSMFAANSFAGKEWDLMLSLLNGKPEPFIQYVENGGDVNAQLDEGSPESPLRYFLVHICDYYDGLSKNERPESRKGFIEARNFLLWLVDHGATVSDEHYDFIKRKFGDMELWTMLVEAQERYREKQKQEAEKREAEWHEAQKLQAERLARERDSIAREAHKQYVASSARYRALAEKELKAQACPTSRPKQPVATQSLGPSVITECGLPIPMPAPFSLNEIGGEFDKSRRSRNQLPKNRVEHADSMTSSKWLLTIPVVGLIGLTYAYKWFVARPNSDDMLREPQTRRYPVANGFENL